MTMEHYRDNKKLRNLTYEHEYSYDSPKSFKYDTYSTFSYFNLNKTMFLGHLNCNVLASVSVRRASSVNIFFLRTTVPIFSKLGI